MLVASEARTWATLMTAVGNFLFHWSNLELQLRTATEGLSENGTTRSGGLRGPFETRLNVWANLARETPRTEFAGLIDEVCGQALNLKKARNLIVHGLKEGASGNSDDDTFIICAEGGYDNPTGETVRYSLAELKHLTQAIDACRRALVDLRYFNYRL